jgi:hypothetical protein
MIAHSSFAYEPTLRQKELQQLRQIFAADGDLMIAGVTGSGRRSLVRHAARQVSARIVEIDCLRATTSTRFLELLAEALLETFSNSTERAIIEQWSEQFSLKLGQTLPDGKQIVWQVAPKQEWQILQALLTLAQTIAESIDCRVVFVFENFPHIRSWDRLGEWGAYLRQEIKQQSHVNYAIIASVPEPWAYESNLQVIALAPIAPTEMKSWLVNAMAAKGLKLAVDALDLFLDYVKGHLGDAIALARRICLEYQIEVLALSQGDRLSQAFYKYQLPDNQIQLHHVHRSTLALVEDLSQTFESLLLLLPPIQARVLESLAIDPTDSPHASQYIRRHQLSKGGGLQGALAGLEQKGLIYGAKYGYIVAMPLLAFWLKHRLI